jgi:protein-disulfide isomerase
MFCIVAFVILAILGIFSASNRELAKEAFDCVGRRVTLRPCNTGFDEKMKAKILGVVIVRSEGAAMFLNKNFELLSWTFFILMLGSTIWAARSLFLFYTSGSCNGLNESGFCVFDPTGANNDVSTLQGCTVSLNPVKGLTLQNVDLSGWQTQKGDGSNKIVFVGSYGCDYTRKTYPMIREMVAKYHADFIFSDYPVKEETDYLSRVGYCVYKQDPEKFWQLNDKLFAAEKAKLGDHATIDEILTGLGLDAEQIESCAADPQTVDTVKKQLTEIQKTNFYGTPTVFINGTSFVGPKPYRVYAIELKGLLYFLN